MQQQSKHKAAKVRDGDEKDFDFHGKVVYIYIYILYTIMQKISNSTKATNNFRNISTQQLSA